MAIHTKKSAQSGIVSSFLDAKASHWAAFRRFHANFKLSFCFLNEISVMLAKFQVEMDLDRNNFRSSLCLKQLQRLHYLWPLGFQPVRDHQRGQHQSQCQSQLSQNLLHKNSKTIDQEPFWVLGIPDMAACEVVS